MSCVFISCHYSFIDYYSHGADIMVIDSIEKYYLFLMWATVSSFLSLALRDFEESSSLICLA